MCKRCRNAGRGNEGKALLIIKCQKRITAEALMDKKRLSATKKEYWRNAKLKRTGEPVVPLDNRGRLMGEMWKWSEMGFFFFDRFKSVCNETGNMTDLVRLSIEMEHGAKTWNTVLKPMCYRVSGTLSVMWTCWTRCRPPTWSKHCCQRAVDWRQLVRRGNECISNYTEVVEAVALQRLVDGPSGFELARLLSLVENK